MAIRTIDVRERVMAKNDELAAEVRRRLRAAGITTFNLVSSPGSGKTTLLERTLAALGEELRIAVVTGDVQTHDDADRLERPTTRPVQACSRWTARSKGAAMGPAMRSASARRASASMRTTFSPVRFMGREDGNKDRG